MYRVVVYHRANKFPQQLINHLKCRLATIVAGALSDKSNRIDWPQEDQNIEVNPRRVMVTEYAAQTGDTNVPPLAIHIFAGESRERDFYKVLKHIASRIHEEHSWIEKYCPINNVEIWLEFHDKTGDAQMKDLI